jgi:hypothetical protein
MTNRFVSGLMGPLRRAVWVVFSWLPGLTRAVVRHRIIRVAADPWALAESSETVYQEMPAVIGRNIPARAGVGLDLESTAAHRLAVHRFSGVEVIHNSRFNSVVVQKTLVLPARKEEGPWALYKGKWPRVVGLINGQSRDLVAIRCVRPAQRYRAALYIGTRAPYNWYHWLANILPALHVANVARLSEDIPVLLPEEVMLTPQMLESLGIFLGGRQVAWLKTDALVKVETLFWADSPVDDSPFAQDHNNRRRLTLHPEAVADFRNRVLQDIGVHPITSGAPSRFFLGRRAHSSRSYNSAIVERWAKEYGFATVYLEDFSFREQVAFFHTATHLIGPTGAAFTNILFAQSRLRALRLHGGAHQFENYFANLATVSGCAIYDLECRATPDGGFLVDEENFRAAVGFLLDDSTGMRES